MLGVGGLSFSRGMVTSVAMAGFTQKAGSKKDSSNFPFTFAPLEKTTHNKSRRLKSDEKTAKSPSDSASWKQTGRMAKNKLTCKL